MPTILDYYEYAKLSTAAYVDMDDFLNFTGGDFAFEANDQKRLPTSIANRMFVLDPENNPGSSVWSIPQGGYYSDVDTGFAATLFEKDGQKVLAIRGTDDPILDFI